MKNFAVNLISESRTLLKILKATFLVSFYKVFSQLKPNWGFFYKEESNNIFYENIYTIQYKIRVSVSPI